MKCDVGEGSERRWNTDRGQIIRGLISWGILFIKYHLLTEVQKRSCTFSWREWGATAGFAYQMCVDLCSVIGLRSVSGIFMSVVWAQVVPVRMQRSRWCQETLRISGVLCTALSGTVLWNAAASVSSTQGVHLALPGSLFLHSGLNTAAQGSLSSVSDIYCLENSCFFVCFLVVSSGR